MATVPAREELRAARLGLFEKWLSVWVALAIVAGVFLGIVSPGLFRWLASLEYAAVNLPVDMLIWAMIYPMMVAVDFGSLRKVGDKPKGLILTVVVNWMVKPFTMAGLAVLFFEVLFALALCSQVLGQGLLVFALGQVPPLVVGIAMLTQPALSAFLGWQYYDERLTLLDLTGALLIVVALVLVRLRGRKQAGREAP